MAKENSTDRLAEKTAEKPTKGADKTMEAGVFYPRHCIVVGLSSEAEAQQAADALQRSGFKGEDVERIDNASFIPNAEHNLESAGILASLGKSANIHKKQLELAREGVAFLVIRAPQASDTERVVAALQTRAVRYAVKYELLVIEDLIQFFKESPSSSPHENAV